MDLSLLFPSFLPPSPSLLQRKSRDVPVFQKLQAIHNFPVSSQAGGGSGPLPSSSASAGGQIKVVASQPPVEGSTNQSVIQSSFPQGSILVVPHPTSPFHAVLPVFANTAVIMPPGATSAPSGSSSSPTPSSAHQAGAVVTLATSAPGGVSQPQQTIAIDGRLLGLGGGVAGATADGAQMLQLVQQAMVSAGVTTATVTPPSGTDVLSAVKEEPSSALQKAPSGPVTAQPATIQFQDYQRFLSMNMVAPVYTMKVEEAVELVKVNFESKSIDITGEVPMTKLDTQNISPEKMGFRDDSSRGPTEDSREPGGDKKAAAGEGKKEGEGEKAAGVVCEGNSVDVVDVVEVALATTLGLPDKGGGGQSDRVDKGKELEAPTPSMLLGGHSSADLMSAELLLSLTGNSSKEWPASHKKSPVKSGVNDAVVATSSPAASGPQTPSSGRKRKQKPIASAKPQPPDKTGTTPTKKRRVRKPKGAVAEGGTATGVQAGKKSLQQFTPEELLQILNIAPDPSTKQDGVKAPSKGRGKAAKGPESVVSKASDKMEQLKASRAVKPMKEYVIETDSDSNSSSSTSSSSHFTPNSGSSSDSSSDSSSNDDSSEPKVKTPVKKATTNVGRGRGRGRGKGRKLEQHGESSSDDDSSSEEEEEEEGEGKKQKGTVSQRGRGKTTRGGGVAGRSRGRGGGGGVRRGDASAPLRGGHVVSIPTKLLKNKKLKPPPEVCGCGGCPVPR